MRRREFISVLGVAAAWPLDALGQKPPPVVGFLASRSPEAAPRELAKFRQALSDAGYIEGKTVAIEYRSAEGHYDRLPALAAELIAQRVAVIAAFGPPAALAAKNATATVPVVFVSGADPVAVGLVASLSRPGGNVTGVSPIYLEMGSKRFAVLAELVPSTGPIAILENPKNPDAAVEADDALAAARTLGRPAFKIDASSEREIQSAFATIVDHGARALFLGSDPFFNFQRDQIIALAAQHGIPTMYDIREAVAARALISYGPSLPEAYGRAGDYVAKILAGAKPADLPVVRATTFDLVINLKTAKALGLSVPESILFQATEVIE